MRRWIPLVVVVASAIATAIAVNLIDQSEEKLTLDSLPEGVSHHEIQGVGVFLAHDGREVVGFVDRAQHLRGERLWWCLEEEVFVSPVHGELFNAEGKEIEGPAIRDLDRVSVTVSPDGVVEVDIGNLQRGTVRDAGLRATGVDPAVWSAYSSWIRAADGSRTFCRRHIGMER